MKFLFLLLQTDYESWGIKSMLIATIIALGAVIGFLYKQNNALQKESRNELKETIELIKSINEKYHQFTDTIKEMLRNGRNN